MGTINCDIEGLKNKVLPPLNSGCNDLESAANIISSIIVPIGFDYTNEVYRIPQKISGIKKEVNEIKKWISEVINKFENAEKQNEVALSKLWDWIKVNWYAKINGVDTTGKTQQQIIEEIIFANLTKELEIDTSWKTREEVIKEIAQKLDIPLTKEELEIMNILENTEPPFINQKDYLHISFGNKTISTDGCGPTSLCMLASWIMGELITPDKYSEYGINIDKYKSSGPGAKHTLLLDEKLLSVFNLEPKGALSWGDAWGKEKVVEALENGRYIIARVNSRSPFTDGGHYILLYGLTEDGKILVRDPYGGNYKSGNEILVDGFANGFDPKDFARWGGTYYDIGVKDPSLLYREVTTIVDKTSDELWEEIKEKSSDKKTTNYWDVIKDIYTQDALLKAEIAENEKDTLINIKEGLSEIIKEIKPGINKIIEKNEKTTEVGVNHVLEDARKEALEEKKLIAQEKVDRDRALNKLLHQYGDENVEYEYKYVTVGENGIAGYIISWPKGMDISEIEYINVAFHGMGENAQKCPTSSDNYNKYYKQSLTCALQGASIKPYVVTIEPQLIKGEWSYYQKYSAGVNQQIVEIMEGNNLDWKNMKINIEGVSAGSLGAESFTTYLSENYEKDINKALIHEGGTCHDNFKDADVSVILGMTETRWKSEKNKPNWIKKYGKENLVKFGKKDFELTEKEAKEGVHHGNVRKYSMMFDSNNIGMSDVIQMMFYDGLIDEDMLDTFLENEVN